MCRLFAEYNRNPCLCLKHLFIVTVSTVYTDKHTQTHTVTAHELSTHSKIVFGIFIMHRR